MQKRGLKSKKKLLPQNIKNTIYSKTENCANFLGSTVRVSCYNIPQIRGEVYKLHTYMYETLLFRSLAPISPDPYTRTRTVRVWHPACKKTSEQGTTTNVKIRHLLKKSLCKI